MENIDIDPLEGEKLLSSAGKGDIFVGKFSPFLTIWLEPDDELKISSYPNPTTKVLSVKIGQHAKSGSLELYTQTGRFVLRKDFEMVNEVLVQIDNSSGLYPSISRQQTVRHKH